MKTKKGSMQDELTKDIDLKSLISRKQPVVHSTFRLSQKGHDAIKEIAKIQGGLKHAEVFDDLLSLMEEYGKKLPLPFFTNKEKSAKIRKTYVVKKETLNKIREFAKNNKISCDLFIEGIASFLRLCITSAIFQKKEEYRNALDEIINPLWKEAENIESKLKDDLGFDDPIVTRFSYVIIDLMNLSFAIESYLKKDIPIDPHDSSQHS